MPRIAESPQALARKKFDHQGKRETAESKNDKKGYIDHRSKEIYYGTRSNVAHGYASALPSHVKTKQDALKLAREMATRETEYPSFGKKPEKEVAPMTMRRPAVMSLKKPAALSGRKPAEEVPYWKEFGREIRKPKPKAKKPSSAAKPITKKPAAKPAKKGKK